MMLRKQGKNPMLVACDIYRPAAIKQLQIVGKNANVPVFGKGTDQSLKDSQRGTQASRALGQRRAYRRDTAGRLHIDEEADGRNQRT